MESLCYLKTTNSLTQSATVPGIPIFHHSTSPSSIFCTPKEAMERLTQEKVDDFNKIETLLKQSRSDYFSNAKLDAETGIFLSDINFGFSNKAFGQNACSQAYNIPEKIDKESRKSDIDGNFKIKQNCEILNSKNSGLVYKDMVSENVYSRLVRNGISRSFSLANLETFRNNGSLIGEKINRGKESRITVQNDPEVKRCRSLPCRLHDSVPAIDISQKSVNKHRKSPLENVSGVDKEKKNNTGNGISCMPRHSDGVPRENFDICYKNDIADSRNDDRCHENDTACHQTDAKHQNTSVSSDDVDCKDDINDTWSGPASPSSCVIDVETDNFHCSPLNLSTNDNESQIINDDCHEVTKNAAKLFEAKIVDTIPTLGVDSCFERSYNVVTKKRIAESPVNETPQEKKTNFSIDAILQPDFGAIKDSDQTTCSFQKHSAQNVAPRCRGTIRSSHSAFTAVDLSTRSRADSLSSPSCSSSSPSPPLSTLTPPPRLNPTFNHNNLYHKQIPDNFLISSRLFKEPIKDFDTIFSGQISFINPLHAHGLANFPFMYTPQGGVQNKYTNDRHQHSQETSRTDNDHLRNDISKLLVHSFYPFPSNAQNNRTDLLKLSRHHGNQIKTGSDASMGVFDNKQKQSSEDFSSSVAKSSMKSLIQNGVFDPKTSSRGRSKHVTPDKGTPVKCKVELKHEKPAHGKEQPEEPARKESGGNSMWPAWVFCTRYSDRPSSGPRSRKPKRNKSQDEKRPRTAFTNDQLVRLKREFEDCRYLTEARRKSLADELGLTESQIKIWFQNKRAKIKKSNGARNPLAVKLMEQGLYNHSTVKLSDDSS